MSPSRPDILASRGAARPLHRLQSHLTAGADEAPGLREVRLDELWLRHQPRKLVPDAVLEALIAADRAQPAVLLAELERLAASEASADGGAARPIGHSETLRALHELAATIRVHGVLVPLRLARVEERYVVEEGHRRSLAALLAGLDRVPAVVAATASDLLLAARQFVANDQRADLSALEKAGWLRELMLKADRELRLRKGWPLDEPPFAALFEAADAELANGASDLDGVPPDPMVLHAGPRSVPSTAHSSLLTSNGQPPAGPAARPPAGQEREHHKGEVRAQVLSLTGLSLGRYYQLRQLNRLCPEARDLGAGLTERHLRPVVVLPPDAQVVVVRAVLAYQVPANKVPTLVRALADGGAEALRRALASLQLPSPRGRVATLHSRLPAVPADWSERAQLTERELTTIKAPHARATRLAQLAQQLQRLEGLAGAYRAILAHYGVAAEPADSTRV
jgi:hypothetical protein